MDQQADAVVCLGDFFDKDTLTGEEITALTELAWADLPHHFVVGNHEASSADLSKSSQHVLALGPDFIIHNTPTAVAMEGCQLCFLPYQPDDKVKRLNQYFPNPLPRVVFSHNNIKGLRMGRFVSDTGLEINDIADNSLLFFNGHLHNRSCLSTRAWNVGNLTGQNFSEDAFKYDHIAAVVDTDARTVVPYCNPHALNFYQVDWTNAADVQSAITQIDRGNAVVSARVKERDRKTVQELLSAASNIIEYRITVEPE